MFLLGKFHDPGAMSEETLHSTMEQWVLPIREVNWKGFAVFSCVSLPAEKNVHVLVTSPYNVHSVYQESSDYSQLNPNPCCPVFSMGLGLAAVHARAMASLGRGAQEHTSRGAVPHQETPPCAMCLPQVAQESLSQGSPA